MMNYVKIRCNQYIKHIEDCFVAIFRFTKYFPPCLYIAYVIQYEAPRNGLKPSFFQLYSWLGKI